MLNSKEATFIELIFGSVLVMLLLAISVVIFFVMYQKRLLKEQRSLQKLHDAHQRQLLTYSIDVQEKERIRIGQDLHDEIGSSLSAIKMLTDQLPEDSEESRQLTSVIRNGLSNTINDVRNIANNLFPAVLSRFGLADALQYLVSVLSAGSNTVAIDLVTDKIHALSFEYELAIYRIMQELINNALNHANAKNLTIRLSQSGNEVLLMVKDDGCGFDAAMATDLKQAGIGIKSVQTRIAVLQANMQITSKENMGTLIEITIPLQAGREKSMQ